MSIDELLLRSPVLGHVFRRTYPYFKIHTAITNGMHVALGLGIGLFLTDVYQVFGIIFLLLGITGHVWAFIKGSSKL